jgi:hypothetical protein
MLAGGVVPHSRTAGDGFGSQSGWALSVQLLGQQLQVRFHSTAPRPDHRLILQYGDDVVHEQRVDLYPERTGSWQFTLPQPAQLPLKVLIATGARDTILEAIANPVVERERITIPPAPSGDDAQTYFLQADALERGALLDEAEAKYLQALEKLPDYLPALNALARMCLEDGRWEECLQYTERALRRDPQNHEAMYLRALCLLMQGREAEAEEWLYPPATERRIPWASVLFAGDVRAAATRSGTGQTTCSPSACCITLPMSKRG